VPYAEVLKVEQQSRVLSAIYEPITRNHRLCAPNKFYEALALGKPLIVCKGTGIDKIVEENNIGCVIEYNVQEFYRVLRELKGNPSLCKGMGERARKLYEEKYKWSIMQEKLLNCYSKL
jgi:glycosyltransferase involved in cell wall biosynthesis